MKLRFDQDGQQTGKNGVQKRGALASLRKGVRTMLIPLVSVSLPSVACNGSECRPPRDEESERVTVSENARKLKELREAQKAAAATQSPKTTDSPTSIPSPRRTKEIGQEGPPEGINMFEDFAPPEPPSAREKTKQATAAIVEFYDGRKGRTYNSFLNKNLDDHMEFFNSAIYKSSDGRDGSLMFPGIAKALEECQHYGRRDRIRIARNFLAIFGREKNNMPNTLELMEKLPRTIVAHVASLIINIGDHNRIKLRGLVKTQRKHIPQIIEDNAEFLVKLLDSLEKGKGIDRRRRINDEDLHHLDLDLEERIFYWPVKLWWVNSNRWSGEDEMLQVWDITRTYQLARYMRVRMDTREIDREEVRDHSRKGLGPQYPSHLRSYFERHSDDEPVSFAEICKRLEVKNCPTEPLAALH